MCLFFLLCWKQVRQATDSTRIESRYLYMFNEILAFVLFNKAVRASVERRNWMVGTSMIGGENRARFVCSLYS